MESNAVAINHESRRSRKSALHDFLKVLQLRIISFRSGNIREHEFFTKKFDRQLLPIGRHGLTAGWLIDSLGQLLNTDAIRNVKCAQLGSDGFVSQIMRVTIEFSNRQQKRFIVKMPETTNIKAALELTTKQKMPEGADEQFIGGLTMFFNREVEFYKMDKIPGLRLPTCFHSQSWKHGKTTGAIVMQDLLGMVSVPYYESLNLQQVASVGSQMLNLHLFSIGMSDEWKTKFPFPMELIDTVSNMTDIVKLYVSRNPELEEGFSRVKKMYTDRELFTMVLRDSHKSLGIDDFLCHGDLWFYNLMWLPTVSGSETASNHLGAIIDWQNVHTGSIAEDFCHMLTFCCDTETRRQAENVFLPYYYNQLRAKAKNAGKKLSLTLNQFLRAYRRNFIAHALHLPFIVSIMLCVKPANDETIQKLRNEQLIQKVLGAWEDAIQALHEEYPEYFRIIVLVRLRTNTVSKNTWDASNLFRIVRYLVRVPGVTTHHQRIVQK